MAIFIVFFLEAKPLILGEFWWYAVERALNKPSNALFGGAVVLLVPELCADLQKNVEKGRNWSLMASGDLNFDQT